jgi:hypothetical protein
MKNRQCSPPLQLIASTFIAADAQQAVFRSGTNYIGWWPRLNKAGEFVGLTAADFNPEQGRRGVDRLVFVWELPTGASTGVPPCSGPACRPNSVT